MSNLPATLRKRRCYPVESHEGVFVRPLTRGEIETAVRLDKSDPLAGMDFTIATALTDKDGAPLFPRSDGELVDAFVSRVSAELSEIPSDTLMDLQAAIESAGRKIKNLEKKSPSTSTPDGSASLG